MYGDPAGEFLMSHSVYFSSILFDARAVVIGSIAFRLLRKLDLPRRIP
jgi:hypothetical protein